MERYESNPDILRDVEDVVSDWMRAYRQGLERNCPDDRLYLLLGANAGRLVAALLTAQPMLSLAILEYIERNLGKAVDNRARELLRKLRLLTAKYTTLIRALCRPLDDKRIRYINVLAYKHRDNGIIVRVEAVQHNGNVITVDLDEDDVAIIIREASRLDQSYVSRVISKIARGGDEEEDSESEATPKRQVQAAKVKNNKQSKDYQRPLGLGSIYI